jgi:L-lactate permease
MATHNPKQGGMATDMLGAIIDAVRVTFGAAGAPTLVDGGKSNLIASVTRNSAGLYTFQLNKNYYKSFIAVLPTLSCISGAGALNTARYVVGSYSSTTGTFQVVVTDDEATPAAADPTNGVALSLLMVFQRYST